MSKITVEYIDHLGGDLTIVNSARISMGKWKDEFDEIDEKLIKYLAKHNHQSPFFHAVVTFRVNCPIFVERQAFKSVVGLAYNSISMRYVEPPNEFYTPDTFRKSSPSIKQGSLKEPVDEHEFVKIVYDEMCKTAFKAYHKLIDQGVCREQARMVLPMSTMTSFIATGSLAAWARVYNLRSKPDAQAEIREYALLIGEQMSKLYPVAWPVLTEEK